MIARISDLLHVIQFFSYVGSIFRQIYSIIESLSNVVTIVVIIISICAVIYLLQLIRMGQRDGHRDGFSLEHLIKKNLVKKPSGFCSAEKLKI